MINHPGEPVPAEMPKDLERVYAAFEVPLDPAPDALLGRVLTSRAEGSRTLLPVERSRASTLRRRMARWAIAAAIGLVALGTWSRLSHPRVEMATTTSFATFGLQMGDDFGLATLAAAQSGVSSQPEPTPKFEPMTFDTSRLHQARLTYLRSSSFGNSANRDTLVFSITRSTSPEAEWIVVREKDGTEEGSSAATTTIDRTSLSPLSISVGTGTGSHYHMTIRENTIAIHGVDLRVTWRKTTARSDTVFVKRDTVVHLPASSRYPRFLGLREELIVKLMAAPIYAGWNRSMVIPVQSGTKIGNSSTLVLGSVDLQVVGEAPCGPPNATMDCWKLRQQTRSSETTLLVRKLDGVLTSFHKEETHEGKRFVSEMVMIHEQSVSS